MTLSKDDLAQLLRGGVVNDIFRAERAYALLECIGNNAEAINTSTKKFGELFGTIQGMAQGEAILSVARLYDPPSKQYQTRCLRALLDSLEEEAEGLPPIDEKASLSQELIRVGIAAADVERFMESSDSEVTRAMVSHYRARLSTPAVKRSVELLKNVRDKRIAHNEEVQSLDGPTWNAVLELLAAAQEIVGIVGLAYLRTSYVHEGKYTLSSDAQRPARAMLRLLEQLEIVAKRRRG